MFHPASHTEFRTLPRKDIDFAALSTQHSALSTQHSALSTQHSALSTQHSALSTQHPAPSTQSSLFGPAHPSSFEISSVLWRSFSRAAGTDSLVSRWRM